MKSRLFSAYLAVGLAALAFAATDASGQPRYRAAQAGDIVTLSDTRTDVVVSVLTTASNAYQMTARGQDVIRRTWATLDDIRGRMGMNGVPLLWPYANRLDSVLCQRPEIHVRPGHRQHGSRRRSDSRLPHQRNSLEADRGQGGYDVGLGHDEARFLPHPTIHDAVLYKELQTIEPGGFWEESFWVRPKGY